MPINAYRVLLVILIISIGGSAAIRAQEAVGKGGDTSADGYSSEATQVEGSAEGGAMSEGPSAATSSSLEKGVGESGEASGVDQSEEGAQEAGEGESELPRVVEVSDPEEETLYRYIKKGGVMMVPLFLLGLAGLTLIFERSIFHYKNRSWEYSALEKTLKDKARNHKSHYQEELEKLLLETRELYMDRLERGMGLLQGIGAIAPLLGFLGTVIGMIGAFSAIAAARTVNAKVVASGIQVALITTAGGLIVAVPIMIVYYIYSHVNHNHFRASNRFIAELCEKLPSMLSPEAGPSGGSSGGDAPGAKAEGVSNAEPEAGGPRSES